MTYIIVGLGNPGEEYENTRHNVGRIVLEALRKSHELSDWTADKKLKALVSEGKVGKEKVMLVEPENFMNNSGGSVKPLVKSKKAGRSDGDRHLSTTEELVVIHDDLDMPFGRIKMMYNRGSGGHRGVESIIKAVGTEAFVRIKVGISPETAGGKLKKPVGEEAVNKFILGKFKDAEEKEFKKVSQKIIESLEILFEKGKKNKAMGREAATMFANTQ